MKKAVFDHKAKSAVVRYCFFCFAFFAASQSFAQTRGKVQVVAPPLFDTLLVKRAGLSKATDGATGFSSFYGYRVQIYSGRNRTAAYNAQAKFNREFPELRTYIVYREPNFKVRAGDFRTRLEAERMKEQLQSAYPSLFIISEKINPPKTDTTND